MGKKVAKVIIKPVKEIPEEMLEEFCSYTGSSPSKIRGSLVKLGAFLDGKIVGFGAADRFMNILNVEAIFVQEKFRGQSIAKRFISGMIAEAHRRKLDGVDVNRMMWNMKWAMDSYAKKNAKLKSRIFSITQYQDEDYGNVADIRFKKPLKAKIK